MRYEGGRVIEVIILKLILVVPSEFSYTVHLLYHQSEYIIPSCKDK